MRSSPRFRQGGAGCASLPLVPPYLFAILILFCLAPTPAARGAALCPVLVGSNIQDVAVADFDEDGLADAAAADAGGKMGLVFGSADPAPLRYGGAVITGVPISRVVAGNVNGDAHADVVAISATGGYLRVLTGHGDGTFSLGDPIATVPNVSHVRGVDLNGDGLTDLAYLAASATGSTGTLAAQLADGAGGYGPPLPAWTGTLSVEDLAAGDLDGDGAADLVTVVNEFVAGVRVVTIRTFHGHGDGTFTELAPMTGPDGLSALAIGDMNEDGRGDLVGLSGYTLPSVASIWLGQADGTLGARADFPKTSDLTGGRAILADLNGDHHLDVAFSGGPIFSIPTPCGFNFIAAMLGHGDGTLTDAGGRTLTTGSTFGMGVGDVNGDGAPDAVFAGGFCGDVAVQPGAGDGTFTTVVNPMRAFTDRHNDAIHVNNNKPTWCVIVEPVDSSFDLLTEAPAAEFHLISEGTGAVSDIVSGPQKEIVVGDADDNGILDMRICFPKASLQQLFSNVNGKQTLTLGLEATIHDYSCKVGTTLTIDVFAGGKGNTTAAFVRPNPLNPSGVLTFRTDARGSYRVRVFDVAGRLVRTLRGEPDAAAGLHDVRIDGKDDAGRPLPSGIYLYRIDTGSARTEGRFVVAK